MTVDPSIESPGVVLSGFVQMFPKIPLILFICLRKLQLNQKNILQNTYTNIPRITVFSIFFLHFTVPAKYKNKLIFLRKIQHKMLRRIQIFSKNIVRSTGNYVVQNTDFYENCSPKYSKK